MPREDRLDVYIGDFVSKLRTYREGLKKDPVMIGRKDRRLVAITKLLYPKYADRLLRLGHQTFPVVVWKAKRPQADEPDSVLLGLDEHPSQKMDPSLRRVGNAFIRNLKASGESLVNLPTYSYKGIQFNNGGISVDCCMGTYFDNLTSCFLLEWELLGHLGMWSRSERNLERLVQKLMIRQRVHEIARGDPVLCPMGRLPLIGITTLILFKRERSYSFVIAKKLGGGGTEGGLYQLVPDGVFQPVAGDIQREFSLKHAFFREYLEELFDFPETRRSSLPSFDDVYSHRNFEHLHKLMLKREARLCVTGVAFDLLTLKLNICLLLQIDSAEWYTKGASSSGLAGEFNLNWEFKRKGGAKKPLIVPVEKVSSLQLNTGNMLSTSAAALQLGLDMAKDFSFDGGQLK